MNPAFAGSRSVGQAWTFASDGKADRAAGALEAAAKEYLKASFPASAKVARDLGRNWPGNAAKIAEGFHEKIQAAMRAEDDRSYHAASVGWTLGLAEWTARLASKQTDVGAAKAAIGRWLTEGRPHADALRTMDDRVPDVSAEYASASSCIAVCKRWGDFGNCVQLVERVAHRIGNGIP